MNEHPRDHVTLRPVEDADLAVFFEQQIDPDAQYMAAFTRPDHEDRASFMAHWRKSLADETIVVRTVIYEGQVAGSVASWVDAKMGTPEVTYWIGKDYWSKGVATEALSQFLAIQKIRPILGRAAKDNIGSLRVMEKCGFVVLGQEKDFANSRGAEIDELILQLD